MKKMSENKACRACSRALLTAMLISMVVTDILYRYGIVKDNKTTGWILIMRSSMYTFFDYTTVSLLHFTPTSI